MFQVNPSPSKPQTRQPVANTNPETLLTSMQSPDLKSSTLKSLCSCWFSYSALVRHFCSNLPENGKDFRCVPGAQVLRISWAFRREPYPPRDPFKNLYPAVLPDLAWSGVTFGLPCSTNIIYELEIYLWKFSNTIWIVVSDRIVNTLSRVRDGKPEQWSQKTPSCELQTLRPLRSNVVKLRFLTTVLNSVQAYSSFYIIQ